MQDVDMHINISIYIYIIQSYTCIWLYLIVYLYLLCTYALTTFQPNPIRPFLEQKYMFRPIRRPGVERLEDFRFCFGSKVPNLGWLDARSIGVHRSPSSLRSFWAEDWATAKESMKLLRTCKGNFKTNFSQPDGWLVQTDTEIEKFTPHLELSGFIQMHLLPPSLPTHVAKVLGHFRTKLNQRSDKSNVDSREFRLTRSILRRIWLLHLNLSRHFSFSKRLTRTSRRLSSGFTKAWGQK